MDGWKNAVTNPPKVGTICAAVDVNGRLWIREYQRVGVDRILTSKGYPEEHYKDRDEEPREYVDAFIPCGGGIMDKNLLFYVELPPLPTQTFRIKELKKQIVSIQNTIEKICKETQ